MTEPRRRSGVRPRLREVVEVKILFVGAGIAGPTLAYWLKRIGHGPAIVESAPGLRRGGYAVDFW